MRGRAPKGTRARPARCGPARASRPLRRGVDDKSKRFEGDKLQLFPRRRAKLAKLARQRIRRLRSGGDDTLSALPKPTPAANPASSHTAAQRPGDLLPSCRAHSPSSASRPSSSSPLTMARASSQNTTPTRIRPRARPTTPAR